MCQKIPLKLIYLLLLLLNFNPAFSQVFIILDEDTAEFITDVNFITYKNHKPVYRGITLNDKATTVDSDFDSISFSKPEYKTMGFRKEQLDTIFYYLKKNTITLEEIVITSSNKGQIVIGEKIVL